ncbi:asparagine--tRNA ligase [Enterobacteriaceae bacterium ET-AT1-13]|nr:asparagine--tRNA ligase [Enterobacteriaceae bacterium ET-AT1-13]WGS66454.1 asparagine--tRNA ligase [Enterobacteriaceae bacterium Cmel17]WMC17479.1 MAG: asparagine--tRNA ligase [Enterobacteriaceae bacterium Cmel21]WMC17686.1 MAG: asparagine--tRNA ligase [Enterobacteriaceae bacterium PSmelAO3-2]WMC17890.1 MAG: asparagine--tRNA ligase [Enterobacteriaceae bacterium PSmelAO3-1]WMC18093.1 MAG: asparagine--tRNA ligase [Enterobacteriaceae bacterium PSmelAO1]
MKIYNYLVINGFLNIKKKILINGWVKTKRKSKNGLLFISIYDGSCLKTCQIVIYKTLKNYNEILNLTTGCSVEIIGLLVFSLGKKQNYEIKAVEVNIIGWVKRPDIYPISSKYHSKEYLREIPHLRPRTNLISAVTRIRHTVAQAIHKFLNMNGFFWISTPLITCVDSEGFSKMFKVSTFNFKKIPYNINNINFKKDFFGKETFLTVSGQLTGEAYACSLSKIYTFGPIFRAENSNTSRHLSEFWMIEPEIAFGTLEDIINLSENMLKYIFKIVLNKRLDDLFFINKKKNINYLIKFLYYKFEQISYTEAIKILLKSNKEFKIPVKWGSDISSEHEHYLCENYFKGPVVIKKYPKNIKPFYMKINKNYKTVSNMDIIVPGVGEIIGGSQREDILSILDKRINEVKLNKKKYWWYRDIRKYGTIPHSGFGLGFERILNYITGLKNIRDVIPYPRSSNIIEF